MNFRYYQSFKGNINPLFQRPFHHQVAGDIRMGYSNSAQTLIGISPDELVQHLLLVGRSGAGKTNVLRILQTELSRLGIPFLAFDLAKHNTRHLKKCIPNLKIIRWDKEFYFNPLNPPPNVKLIEWLLTFCEVTSEVFGLMAASKSLLIDAVDYLYRANDTENTKNFPTIHDLNRILDARRKTTRSRIDLDYIDRIKNKTKALCITFNKSIDVKQGIPIDEIIKQPVCIEFVGINSFEIQTWIITLLMSWIASFQKTQGNSGILKHVIFYDEASHAYSRDRTKNTETILIRQLRTLRENGEAIVLADQSISSLIDVVKSNIYTFICLSQTSPNDIREISLMLNLNQEQAGLLNKLPQGQGIIKLAGRFPYPHPIRFPFIEPCPITDDELDVFNERDEFMIHLKDKIIPARNQEKDTNIDMRSDKIDDNIRNFLMAVNFYQFKKPLSEITKLAKFSAGTGSRIAGLCGKKNLIKIIQVSCIRGRPKYPLLTPEAYQLLGLQEKKFFGKGAGLEHILYQHLIAEHFNKYKPIIEFNADGKFIDVAIKTDEHFLCIEVAITPVHEKANIEKNISIANADFIITACKDKKVQESVKKNSHDLPESFHRKTKAVLISEILNSDAEKFVEKIFSEISKHKQGSLF